MEPVRASLRPDAPIPRTRRAREGRSSLPGCCGRPVTSRSASSSGWQPATSSLARSPELPSYLRRLGDADELAVLLRLLLLGVPVSRVRFGGLVGTGYRRCSQKPAFSYTTAKSSTARRGSFLTTGC